MAEPEIQIIVELLNQLVRDVGGHDVDEDGCHWESGVNQLGRPWDYIAERDCKACATVEKAISFLQGLGLGYQCAYCDHVVITGEPHEHKAVTG